MRERRTVNVSATVLELAMFSTWMVTWRLETDCVGVPEMTPVAVFSERPEGSDPEVTE